CSLVQGRLWWSVVACAETSLTTDTSDVDDERPPICATCGVTMVPVSLSAREERAGEWNGGACFIDLKLSGEVEALIRRDEVGGAQVEVVVEAVPQLEQDRLEVGDQLGVRHLRESLVVHGWLVPRHSKPEPGPIAFSRSVLLADRPATACARG